MAGVRTEFNMALEGMDELRKTLAKMLESLEPNEVEPVLLEAADIITQEVRARYAPHRKTGRLDRACVTKLLQRKGKMAAPAISAVDQKMAPEAAWLERGTKPRYHKSGKFVGKVKATYFFARSVIAKGDLALQYAVKKLGDKVERAMDRSAK